jgi:hypothetical protein
MLKITKNQKKKTSDNVINFGKEKKQNPKIGKRPQI